MNKCSDMFLAVLSSVLTLSAVADDADGQRKQREHFAIACAGVYEYQYEQGGFDPVLLMYKRELMGQLVYNDVNGPHYEDKEYFEEQVKLAYGALVTLPEEDNAKYRYEQWQHNPVFCDELAATTFILLSTHEWVQGGGRELSEARQVLRDIYPWPNETLHLMRKDLDNRHQHVIKTRSPEINGPESTAVQGTAE